MIEYLIWLGKYIGKFRFLHLLQERVQKECKNKNTGKYFPLDHNFFSFTDFTKVLDEISIDLVSFDEKKKKKKKKKKKNR